MTIKTFWIAAQNPAAMTALLIGSIDMDRGSKTRRDDGHGRGMPRPYIDV